MKRPRTKKPRSTDSVEALVSPVQEAHAAPCKPERLEFKKLHFRVLSAADFGFEHLPNEEQAEVQKCVSSAAATLALKNVGVNRSRGQTGDPHFDRMDFSFRAHKYLPALRERINEAIDKNDLKWFVHFGGIVAKVLRQPTDQVILGDPLGQFLVMHWADRRLPLCRMSSAVLAQVCQHCVIKGRHPTNGAIEQAVHRLGLKRTTTGKLASCGVIKNGRILIVATSAVQLRRQNANVVI